MAAGVGQPQPTAPSTVAMLGSKSWKAHTLKISLSGDSASQQSAAVCVGPFPSASISIYTAAGHLSLLPATSTALHFQYATSWTSAVGEPPFYFVAGAAKGVPVSPIYTFWRSRLAMLNLTVNLPVEVSRSCRRSPGHLAP